MKRTTLSVLLIAFLSMLFLAQSVCAYENTEYGFSITPPADWEMFEWGDGGVTFTDPETYAVIGVGVENTNLTLSDYVTEIKQRIQSDEDITDFHVVSEGSRNIGGLGGITGYEIVSTYTLGDEGPTYKDTSIIFVENRTGFIVGYGAELSDYDKLLPVAEESIQTFRVTSSSQDTTLLIILAIVIPIVAVVIAVVLIVVFFLRKKGTDEPVVGQRSTSVSPQVSDSHAEAPSTPRFCGNCGAEIQSDAFFCENCGKRLAD